MEVSGPGAIVAGGDVTGSTTHVRYGDEYTYNVLVTPDSLPRRFLPLRDDPDLDLLGRRREAAARRDAAYAEHFLPKARASVTEKGFTWDFVGRRQALSRIASWLADPAGNPPALVVTGGAGSGKTALLGLVAALADDRYEPHVPRSRIELDADLVPPLGSFDETLYAGDMLAEEIVDAVSVAAGLAGRPTLPELRRRLRQRLAGGGSALVLLVDAVDEAGDPEMVIGTLAGLLKDGTVRLLLGMRPRALALLDERCERVDLDAAYADPEAMRRSVEHGLLQAAESSPFRQAGQAVVARVVEGVVRTAGPSFLVARLLVRMLAHRADLTWLTPGWREELSRMPGEIMEQSLRERLGDDLADRALDLLRPLAFAEGSLPDEDIWIALAVRLSGRHYDYADVVWLREHAASYVVTATDQGHRVYRPFHQTLADHLRDVRDQRAVHRQIADFLLEHTPAHPDGTRQWDRASFYTRSYLATHIGKAGGHEALEGLMLDPGYLLAADPYRLLGALAGHRPGGPEADAVHAAVNAYRQAAPDFLRFPASPRPAVLDLAARAHGARTLLDRMAPVPPSSPWRIRWLDLKPQGRGRYTLTTLPGSITRLSVFDHEGHPHVMVASSEGRFEVWNLETSEDAGSGRMVTGTAITGTAAAVHDDHVYLATSDRSDVLLWDLFHSDRPVREWRGSRWRMSSETTAVAFAEIDGSLLLHVMGQRHGIDRYDVTAQAELPSLEVPEGYEFLSLRASVDVAHLGGRTVAAIGALHRVLLVDLRSGEISSHYCRNPGFVTSVRIVPGDVPRLLTGQDTHRINEIDLDTGPVNTVRCPESVFDVDVHVRDGVALAAAGYDYCDRPMEVFRLGATYRRISGFHDPPAAVTQVRIVRLSHGHTVIVAGEKTGRVQVWDLPEATP
jgi:hypothetical protein